MEKCTGERPLNSGYKEDTVEASNFLYSIGSLGPDYESQKNDDPSIIKEYYKDLKDFTTLEVLKSVESIGSSSVDNECQKDDTSSIGKEYYCKDSKDYEFQDDQEREKTTVDTSDPAVVQDPLTDKIIENREGSYSNQIDKP